MKSIVLRLRMPRELFDPDFGCPLCELCFHESTR